MQKGSCEYSDVSLYYYGPVYICIVQNQPENFDISQVIKNTNHLENRNYSDVTAVYFENCILPTVPQGLTKLFPNLVYLIIDKCDFAYLRRESLTEYQNLKMLDMSGIKIPFLQGDVFDDLKSLETLDLHNCSIALIEPKVFDNLSNLKHIDLMENLCINKFFSAIEGEISDVTFDELKQELLENYRLKFNEKIENNLKEDIEYLRLKLAKKDKEYEELDQFVNDTIMSSEIDLNNVYKKCELLMAENAELKSKLGFFEDIETVIKSDELKDFTIKTDYEEFKAHRFVLAARSSVFADMFKENIHAECLNLVDVTAKIFRVILDFIYKNKIPENEDVDFFKLLKACERLKIEKLKTFAAEKLINKVNNENALEVLTLSIKFGFEELQKKSFLIIKKFLSSDKIDDKLMNNPEKLKNLMEIVRKKNEIMKAMDEKFNSVLNE
ncbi:hypothetical protein PVAND_000897 [Polypedilum vanderplanki]|uniref:BTB domain-containing protein n=1 Tax=Polypedilum vanderplanki TaxID=319348 RepID=A0A9J6BL95_POLVA|nr:hypothetical protein PVAND_000897 [Polypedilum vanderplanki]